jgi:hypothetical protein
MQTDNADKPRVNNPTSQTLSPLSPPNSRPIPHETTCIKSRHNDNKNYYAGLCVDDLAHERNAEWTEIGREVVAQAEKDSTHAAEREQRAKRSALNALAVEFQPRKRRLRPDAQEYSSREKDGMQLRAEGAVPFRPSQQTQARVPALHIPTPKQVKRALPEEPITTELGEYIKADVALLKKLGWSKFVQHLRQRSDFASLDDVHHPAKRLLNFYKHRGAPVKLATAPWTQERVQAALRRGPHKSCNDYLDFLREEFVDMRSKMQWVVLPISAVKDLPGLRISPPGCVPQRDRRPRWIVDYSFSEVNAETIAICAVESMQFGHALDRILWEILLADPMLGPVQLLKVDISDGFYRINMNIDDIPKLGVAFPSEPGEEKLVAFPLVLAMGWKNSPPIFSTATETIADLANQRLKSGIMPPPHKLDDAAESVPSPSPLQRDKPPSLLRPPKRALPSYKPPRTRSRKVRWSDKQGTSDSLGVEAPSRRDPSLPRRRDPVGYIDVFVDDFVALAQQRGNSRRVRRTLLHAIDSVLRPLDAHDDATRREPVSMKKLLKGDCSWGTIKNVLGWIIDTVAMTVHLPLHRAERLAEILSSIPLSQKRTSVKKWHKVLGELRSMALALPGARHLFSHMQLALSNKICSRVNLTKGVHGALEDFRWLLRDLQRRPTRIAELVPLLAAAEGHHDASGKGAGGVWFPAKHLAPRRGYKNQPVLWRLKWPQHIIDQLVTSTNPNGTISNSDLELAGGLLHLEAIAQCFDVRERTVLSKTDNLNTLFWQRKASTTTDKCPAHLLRLFGIHQRFHRYVPRHDYLSGPWNPVADATSRDFHLAWPDLITSLSPFLLQKDSCQIWTPNKEIVSSVISALQRNKRVHPESLWVEPEAPSPPGRSGKTTVLTWASIPFSKPSKTKYQSYKSLHSEYVLENLRPEAIPSSLDRSKITYGTLHRRSLVWGPTTHGNGRGRMI